MNRPVAVERILGLIRELLFYMPPDRLTIGRARLLRAGVDPYDADLAFGFLEKTGVISNYKKSEALPLELYEDVYDKVPVDLHDREGDYYHDFAVNVDMLQANDSNTIVAKGEIKTAFSEPESSLLINDNAISLPPFKNEFYFVKAMFNKGVNVRVDWSVIYEELTGEEASEENKSERRKIYDTCLAINQRIEQATGIKNFFIWETKTIRRRM